MGGPVSEPRSVSAWADEQRALRDRAAFPGFDPPSQPVSYRVIAGPGPDVGRRIPGILPKVALVAVALVAMLVELPGLATFLVVGVGFWIIVRWFWRGAGAGRSVAVSPAGAPPGAIPLVVFGVGDDVLVHGPASGDARAFGDLVPSGVFGLVVDGTTVWPTGPPRAGTARDAERSRPLG